MKSEVSTATTPELLYQDHTLLQGEKGFKTVDQRANRSAQAIIWLTSGLFIFIAWASLFEIEQSVRAQGQFIPTQRTQIVQAAENGVVSAIHIQVGDLVDVDQLLIELNSELSLSAYEEYLTKIASLQIARQRAWSELYNVELTFDDALKEYPDLVSAEQSLYNQRRRALNEELALIHDSLALAKQELKIQENLLRTGDTSQLEVMRAKRQVTDIQGQVTARQNEFRNRSGEELSRIQTELSQQEHRLSEKKYFLGKTELRSPVLGSVNLLNINTIGGVVRAGEPILEIIPLDSDILLEVKINPSDIAGLRTGLPVSIKLDAFDFPVYGKLDGELAHLSTDTITEQIDGRTASFYQAHVRVLPDQMNHKIIPEMIKHGMTAGVQIQTGNRTVLEYITKPILRAFDGALIEN